MHIPYYGENTDNSADVLIPEKEVDQIASDDKEKPKATPVELPDNTVH